MSPIATCNHEAFRALDYVYCPVCGQSLTNPDTNTPSTITIDRDNYSEPWEEFHEQPITLIERCKGEFERRMNKGYAYMGRNRWQREWHNERATDYLASIEGRENEIDPMDFADAWFDTIFHNEQNAINQIWMMNRLLHTKLPETFTNADVAEVMTGASPSLVTMLRYGILEEVGIKHHGFLTLHFGKKVEMTSKIYRVSDYAYDMLALYESWADEKTERRIKRYQRYIDGMRDKKDYLARRILFYEGQISDLRK